MDREKVVEGLEKAKIVIEAWVPMFEQYNSPFAIDCAIELLKEQEAVKPRVSSVEQRCGNCNKVIEMDGWITCPWCGKRIDWEGR